MENSFLVCKSAEENKNLFFFGLKLNKRIIGDKKILDFFSQCDLVIFFVLYDVSIQLY